MATHQQPATRVPDDHDAEEQLEDSLEHLKELHLRLRALRIALPHMIEPFVKPSTPQGLHKAFVKSIHATNEELQAFRQAYTSEESNRIFDQAAKSRQANPKGILPWQPRDDPEWTTLKKKSRSSTNRQNTDTNA